MKKTAIITFILLSALCIAQLALYASLDNDIGRTIIVRISDYASVKMNGIDKTEDDGFAVAAVQISGASAGTQICSYNEQVSVCEATAETGSILNLNMLYGSFLVSSDTESPCAVVDEELALKLFKTADCIGQELILDEKKYAVCGVYKRPDGFLYRLSDDNIPRVYVTYEKNAASEYLLVKAPDNANETACIDRVTELTGSKVEYDSMTKTGTTLDLIRQLAAFEINLTIFILAVSCILISAFHIKNSPRISGTVILACVVAIIISAIAMPISIPSEYLETENIFDIGKWVGNFVEYMQKMNSMQRITEERMNASYQCSAFGIAAAFALCAAVNAIVFAAELITE